jgi:drug/metabolite transporter (DMT)-like permease
LPAATVSLMLNLSPMIIALLSGLLIKEQLSRHQWSGVILTTGGVIIYFLPLDMPIGQVFGLAIALLGVLANSGSSLLGRQVNQASGISPLLVTFVSMGVGAFLLLIVGIASQGLGELHAKQWAIIGWLAIVNTAFAFTLWNHTLRTLTAVESSTLNSTMLPQTILLAWLLLGESLAAKQIIGLVLVGVGVLVVQLRRATCTVNISEIHPHKAKQDVNHISNFKRTFK